MLLMNKDEGEEIRDFALNALTDSSVQQSKYFVCMYVTINRKLCMCHVLYLINKLFLIFVRGSVNCIVWILRSPSSPPLPG